MKRYFVRVLKPFYDDVAEVERTRVRPIFETNEERAKKLMDQGLVEKAWIVDAPEEDTMTDMKSMTGPPEDKSMPGPPENKAEKPEIDYEEQTVSDLRRIAEKLDIDLPGGYIKKDELIELIEENR